MAQFPFILDGIYGDVPINFYPCKDSEKQIILRGTPGLNAICTLTDCTEVRGLYSWNGNLYAVAQRGSESVLWRVPSDGVFSELGTITTSASGPVWMANNSSQLLIVDGVSGYTYTPSTGIFVQISDLDFPGAAAADYQDGYGLFIEPDSIQWFFSDINDFKTYDATDVYSTVAKPGNLVSLISYFREVWLFKEKFTEIWYNAGGDNSSPATPTFARNAGGLIEIGCGAARSPSTTDGTALIWLSNRRNLIQCVGYNPKEISNQMFAREVESFASFSDAVAFSYYDSGHTFYQINFPTGGKTWVYDLSTGLLHKKQSWKTGGGWGRHRANCYATLNNKHYVGDYANGKIYEMSNAYYDDDGEEIRRELCSQEHVSGLKYTRYPDVMLDCEMGVGIPQAFTPNIMLQFSGDGGHTWSSEIWREAGAIGEYTKRAIWRRMGSGVRRMYKLVMTDPVPWNILGAYY